MARREHIIVGKETNWGTWQNPDLAFPFLSFTPGIGWGRIEDRMSGASRALTQRAKGAKQPSGSGELVFWTEEMGRFFKAAQLSSITTTTPVGATNTREHGILPDDGAAVSSLSVQAQYTDTVAVNLLGVVLNTLSLSCVAGEYAKVSFDYIARDEAPVGGVWDYDGQTTSPALIASPVYLGATIRPFVFTGATLITGGTVTLDPTKRQMSITGGTTHTNIERVELTIENSLDARVALGASTPVNVVPQDRVITVSFDYIPAEMDTQFYTDFRAGTQMALQLKFRGPLIESSFYREAIITLPLLDFSGADWPDITGTRDRRVRSVSGMAVQHDTIGYDIGITLRDTVTGY